MPKIPADLVKLAIKLPPVVKCVACGGTGRASNGRPCRPCELAGRIKG